MSEHCPIACGIWIDLPGISRGYMYYSVTGTIFLCHTEGNNLASVYFSAAAAWNYGLQWQRLPICFVATVSLYHIKLFSHSCGHLLQPPAASIIFADYHMPELYVHLDPRIFIKYARLYLCGVCVVGWIWGQLKRNTVSRTSMNTWKWVGSCDIILQMTRLYTWRNPCRFRF